jgi:nickel-dependent lactate racemase
MIIDVVVHRTREIAGVFVGDVQEAFLKGVDFARKTCRTPVPTALDVAVLNAYPKDTDLVQSENALNILQSTPQPFVKEHGKILLMTASSQDVGMHGLFVLGGRLYHKPIHKLWLREKGLILYAPNVNAAGARSLFWEGYPFCQTWQEVLEELQRASSDQCCRVGAFPCSSIQLEEII